MAEKQKMLQVRSTLPVRKDGGSQVALLEVDERHPGGRALVAGREPVTVADTRLVRQKITEGSLVEVGSEEEAALLEEPNQEPAKPGNVDTTARERAGTDKPKK